MLSWLNQVQFVYGIVESLLFSHQYNFFIIFNFSNLILIPQVLSLAYSSASAGASTSTSTRALAQCASATFYICMCEIKQQDLTSMARVQTCQISESMTIMEIKIQ